MKNKKKLSEEIPPEKLRLYEQLVYAVPEIELKSNFGSAYTAINGNMFSMISKLGYVGIRLPKDERAKFIEQFNTTIYEPKPWPPLKEYVAIPDDLLNDTGTLKKYLEMSLEYAKTLKPKPQKKKK